MREDRFKRIIRAIWNREKINSNDRRDFEKLIRSYQKKEDTPLFFRFVDKNPVIENKDFFEKFICDVLNISKIEDFDKEVLSKKESIEIYGDSKKKNLHTSNLIVVLRKRYQNPIIYCKDFPKIEKVVAVENFESFLKIDFSLFDYEWFVYLGGETNKKVREFLRDKEVLFFVDFDFEGIEIFENFKCKRKDLFLPDNIEALLRNSKNQKLYLKQRPVAKKLKLTNKNAKKLYEFIMKYARVLEQEILDKDC